MIAEVRAIVRIGLRSVLSADRDVRVVAEAADGATALRLVERHHPHILTVGLISAGSDPMELIRQTRSLFPATFPVVYSRFDNQTDVLESLQAGARGYILKAASPTQIVKALREVLCQRTYIGPELPESFVASVLRKATTGPLNLYQTLSAREREVLQLCAEGLTSKAIGSRLGISYRTVEVHRANLMEKLGLHNVAEVVRFAIEHHVLTMWSPALDPARIARTGGSPAQPGIGSV